MIRKSAIALAAVVSVMWGGAAFAGTPTALSCDLEYKACDAKCNFEDPKHGFSYATCSAGCVASKAACSSKIIYDKSSTWTKEQYDAAKPWVKEKAEQAGDLADDVKDGVDKALENSKQDYPQ